MFYTLFDSNKYQLRGNIYAASFRNLQHFLQKMGLLIEKNIAAEIVLPLGESWHENKIKYIYCMQAFK